VPVVIYGYRVAPRNSCYRSPPARRLTPAFCERRVPYIPPACAHARLPVQVQFAPLTIPTNGGLPAFLHAASSYRARTANRFLPFKYTTRTLPLPAGPLPSGFAAFYLPVAYHFYPPRTAACRRCSHRCRRCHAHLVVDGYRACSSSSVLGSVVPLAKAARHATQVLRAKRANVYGYCWTVNWTTWFSPPTGSIRTCLP